MSITCADRLAALPPFLFVEIDTLKRRLLAEGRDIVDLGVGDPDLPTPRFIVDALCESARSPANHRYPPPHGSAEFRAAAARFLERRFGVRADPQRHILACLGSKDGIAHLPLALANPGDTVITPEPAYPVYQCGAILAGARPVPLHLAPESGWVPDPASLDEASLGTPRLFWMNYPNNPMGASAGADDYARVIHWCAPRQIVVASDLAYSELYFGDERPPSLWQAPGASLEHTPAIEFHSLSKTFSMPGWRIGFAVGREDVIAALRRVKDNYDSGVFAAIQDAAAVALHRFDDEEIGRLRAVYRERRDIAVAGLRAAGCHAAPPSAGTFVWARVPGQITPGCASALAKRWLEEAGVLVIPGSGFGPSGEGYLRISLTVETGRLIRGMERLARVGG